MADLTKSESQGGGHLASWNLTQADPTGASLSQAGAADRTVHVFGTFAGGTVTLQGSNDPAQASWATLHDADGSDLTFTVDGIALVAENPLHIRPLLTGAGPSADVNVVTLTRPAR